MKYRDHKGGLEESMATVQEFETKEELLEYLDKRWAFMVEDISFKHMGYDDRVDWDTYYVLAHLAGFKKPVVVGMSNDKF